LAGVRQGENNFHGGFEIVFFFIDVAESIYPGNFEIQSSWHTISSWAKGAQKDFKSGHIRSIVANPGNSGIKKRFQMPILQYAPP
jgi:hypothetical protein